MVNKKYTLLLISALTAVVVAVSGCAKAPDMELKAAKDAIQAAVAAEAPKYAAQELKQVENALAAAEGEIKTQESKFFKNFDIAKQMLAKTNAEAEALAASIPARKDAAKKAAEAALGEASAAVLEAKELLAQAPRGKGTRADIEAFTADLKGIEDALAQANTLITAEDFFAVPGRAQDLKARANAISEQIRTAMSKVRK